MFKKYERNGLIKRFKEFDEVRKYIENMEKLDENTMAAIDYIITHKEYYFLIKTLYEKLGKKNIQTKLYDYIFFSMDICPRRKEDYEIYLKVLKSSNFFLKKSLIEFLKTCNCQVKDFALELLTQTEPFLRKTGIEILKHCPQKELKRKIMKVIQMEHDKDVLKEFFKYMKLFSSPDDKDFLKMLSKRFPEFKNKIEEIIKGL
jgi:hypothetical protein